MSDRSDYLSDAIIARINEGAGPGLLAHLSRETCQHRIYNAMKVIVHNTGVIEATGKAWVIDQVVRELLGNDGYHQIRTGFELGGLEWEIGTDPNEKGES